ncbi:MAG TPA: MFS transporter [Steroidobacteraceae bacterium]|nr:MFS transporter [Steroidobacteraceae bacterium]
MTGDTAVGSPARMLLFCVLAALCEGFDVQTAGVAAGGLSRELHPTAGALGVFFAAGNAGLLLGAIGGGRLADRWGHKRVLLASLATFGVFSLATAVAPDMASLTAMRFLTGIGLGGAMPNLMALAAIATRATSRNASIATTYVGFPLGAVLSSVIIIMSPQETWRIVFVCGGVAPLIITPLMAVFMPADERSGHRSAGRPAGSFVFDLFEQGRWPRTLLAWAGFFLGVLTLHLMLTWLPVLLQASGLSKNQAALAQAAFNIGGAAAGLLAGFLLDGARRQGAVLCCVIALPVSSFLLASSAHDTRLVYGVVALVGAAVLAAQVIFYGFAQAIYPLQARGTGLGAAVGAGRAGSIVGPMFVAMLVGAGRTPQQVLLGILPIVVGCGLCMAALEYLDARSRGMALAGPRVG